MILKIHVEFMNQRSKATLQLFLTKKFCQKGRRVGSLFRSREGRLCCKFARETRNIFWSPLNKFYDGQSQIFFFFLNIKINFQGGFYAFQTFAILTINQHNSGPPGPSLRAPGGGIGARASPQYPRLLGTGGMVVEKGRKQGRVESKCQGGEYDNLVPLPGNLVHFPHDLGFSMHKYIISSQCRIPGLTHQ